MVALIAPKLIGKLFFFLVEVFAKLAWKKFATFSEGVTEGAGTMGDHFVQFLEETLEICLVDRGTSPINAGPDGSIFAEAVASTVQQLEASSGRSLSAAEVAAAARTVAESLKPEDVVPSVHGQPSVWAVPHWLLVTFGFVLSTVTRNGAPTG